MDRSDKDFLPELLAPAGSPESLDAAIEAGADAVYFGAGDFNARMRAKNFTPEEMSSSLEKCAEYGIKTYVTVNTRLRDSELGDVLSLAKRLYLDGASALIVADPGAISLIKRAIPGMELHASTQLSGHSARDAAYFASLGVSRMVCPREMSLDEIRELCRTSPIETEMFIHGAHCVSFSGQCLMSYALGGRSGNRGMCAQPCRLPFNIEGAGGSHPLSLKDMCLAGSVRDIISSGVASLKIEGRQKSPDYVWGTVRIYRKLLDERRDATEDEIGYLSELFSRDGFTDGYLKRSYGKMLGMRQSDGQPGRTAFSGLKRKIPVDVSLTVKTGEAAKFAVTDGRRSAESFGAVVSRRGSGEGMSCDAAKEKAGKLGNTAFFLRDFSAKIDGDAYFTLTELNGMRRAAVRSLAFPEERKEEDILPAAPYRAVKRDMPEKRLRTAEFTSFSQIPGEALSYFDKIYIPFCDAEHADGDKICICADPLTYDPSYDEFCRVLKGYRGEVMVHGFGQATAAKECGATPVASFRFNVMNSLCAGEVLKIADAVTVSPEVPSALCRDICGTTCAIIYGRIPLMHTERCALSDGGVSCRFGGAGGRCFPAMEKTASRSGNKECDGVLCRGEMIDRTGTRFPIIGLTDCSNIICNSVPIYMADKRDFLDSLFADRLHFIFSVESCKECGEIIDAYITGAAPLRAEDVRRMK